MPIFQEHAFSKGIITHLHSRKESLHTCTLERNHYTLALSKGIITHLHSGKESLHTCTLKRYHYTLALSKGIITHLHSRKESLHTCILERNYYTCAFEKKYIKVNLLYTHGSYNIAKVIMVKKPVKNIVSLIFQSKVKWAAWTHLFPVFSIITIMMVQLIKCIFFCSLRLYYVKLW